MPDSQPPPPRTLSDLVEPSDFKEPARMVHKRIGWLKSKLGLPNLIETSSNTPDGTSDTPVFHLFPELPIELRIRIFQAVLTTQEIYAIGWDADRLMPIRTSPRARATHQSWHDYVVQTAIRTEKSYLLCVNSESRAEAKSSLEVFERGGCKTWYNPATDVAWFPRFENGDDDLGLCDLGFWTDHSLQRMTLPYHLWINSPDRLVGGREEKFSFDRFCKLGLREIVIRMGDDDLQSSSSVTSVTANSKPSDFFPSNHLKSAEIKNATWGHVAQGEVHDYKSCPVESLVAFIDNFLGCTVPTISFCLENGSKFPLN
ncbi:uncharacterized protein RCO7_02792 [Rhynchosporium graminicola]|uniref:2EXR domain-containing protein n=1 Tax=Rhynchosporium graminicola TaxID=2792576 RepID=A0A1E1KSS2_9HELO|nr:uncharacterized protein RCO7_02792 [Rhynchosporium commune]